MSRPFFPESYGTVALRRRGPVPGSPLGWPCIGYAWAFTHWFVSHTRPVVAASGTRGSGVAAE
jgi:hypothetical protein